MKIQVTAAWQPYVLGALLAVVMPGAPSWAREVPVKDDFARGWQIEPEPGRPLQQITLPDEIYAAITRADLGDLRVFNADGAVVPHAFCAAEQVSDAQHSQHELPVFQLRQTAQGEPAQRVQVETADGTRIAVEGAAGQAATDEGTYIIDATMVEHPLRAVSFQWQSPDGASQVRVRIESSDDLNDWQVVVPESTLLHVAEGDRQLRRESIELPPRRYRYLRVRRVDAGPPLQVLVVIAQAQAEGERIDPVWFQVVAQPAADEAADEVVFDAGRRAPVSHARLQLALPNSSVSLRLFSRDEERGAWQPRWNGESYSIIDDDRRRDSPPAQFPATADRYWKVQFMDDAPIYRDSVLELGYYPARLQFLARGSAPFTVAFASRRAPLSAPAACGGLLADVAGQERASLTGTALPGPWLALGGEQALKPLPPKTPLRQWVLWGVLVAGVALIVVMALSLLKRVRPEQ